MANYKTTLLGVGFAVLTALQTYQGGHGWKGYVVAIGIAAFGYFTKDA